jgi:glycosyltransferase involved in cell wall biosynthesis
MRILQLNNSEAVGGGSDRVYQLTTRMLLDRGHDVATLSCGDQSFDLRKTTVLLPRNGYFSQNPFKTLCNIREFVYRPDAAEAIEGLVHSFKPDIAHLHIFYGQLSSSVIAALRRLQVPCVMTVHEYRLLCPISTLYTQSQGVCERCATGEKRNAIALRCNRGSPFASLLSASESWVRDRYFNYLDHIAHFFMVSEFCRNKHSEYLPAILQKSSVLYNFIGDTDIAGAPNDVAVCAPFLYVGRLSHEKGVALLCSALRDRPQQCLRIAGDGPLAEPLRTEFADCSNIKFLGKLTAIQLKEEMRQAKFTIVPSEWYENNPMSVLESFGIGTPVIGADIGGIPELVRPGSTGIIFSPSNKASLLQALDDAHDMSRDERNTLGRVALDLIRHHHSEAGYCAQLITGYTDVIRKFKKQAEQ